MDDESDSTRPLPAHITIDRLTQPGDVLEFDLLSRAMTGAEPFVRRAEFAAVIPPAVLVPPAFSVERSYLRGSRASLLARSQRSSLVVAAFAGSTVALAAANTPALLDDVIAEVTARARPFESSRSSVRLQVWRHTPQSVSSATRSIEAADWRDVAPNYPSRTRAAVAEVTALRRPAGTARLILWHGPPGTGKTTAVLALMRAWASWCDSHLIADPEKMFEEPHYLLDVLSALPSGAGDIRLDGEPPPRRWKLIVAEDADEYLRSDARRRSGPALGRLLNAADGILGRGLNCVILLTTNDDVGRLHPAVVRPGRCLALVEFPAFSPLEAARWLDGAAPASTSSVTLAELFRLRGEIATIGIGAPEAEAGAYL